MKTQVSTAEHDGPIPVPDVLPSGSKAGPWIIERELGRGGMGAVYAVVHQEIGKRAALKVVHHRLLVPGFNADRMLLEAKVVNQVGHPNIVDIFETGRLADQRPYIVMERLEGQPLSFRADEGKILPDQVIAILLQICDALIAAHAAGIIHRDLKLDNVFLVDNPEDLMTPRVKLLDWGIAKVINHEVRHTIEGQLVGTPQYLAPEQARGGPVSPQSDVYSLGVMAYELFLEQLPFEAETSAEIMAMHLRATPPPPSELWPDIPPPLEELISEMLAKAPHHRPTMLEVAHRLEAVRNGLRQRSREVFLNAPTCATIAPEMPFAIAAQAVAPSDAHRVSSPGLAPTLPAEWRSPSRRWQWAIGGLAILASATMFLVSRTGDLSGAPAAAALPDIRAEITVRKPTIQPVTPPHTVASMPVTEETTLAAAPPKAEPTQAAQPSPPTRPTTRSAHVRPSSRKAPVTPRRAAARIPPDGTLDPYR